MTASANGLSKSGSSLLCLFLLCLISFAAFWQTTGFGFIWDDKTIHLLDNPYFNPVSLSGMMELWQKIYKGLYIPLSYNLWGMIELISFKLTGQKLNPFSFHLANVILHTFNGMLIFFLLRKMIHASWPCFLGAALFLIHPVQVEPVAWVSEFRGLLSCALGLSALLIYLNCCKDNPTRKTDRRIYIFMGLSWILFSLSLLAKPSSVVILLFMGSCSWYLYRLPVKKLAIHLLFFSIPVILITAITSIAQKEAVSYALWLRPLIWMDAIQFYLQKTVLPFNLTVVYGRTLETLTDQWWFYLSWIFPCIAGAVLFKIRNKYPLTALGGLLFILGFLPVSGLKTFHFQLIATVADRYLYLSMAGIALIFTDLISRISKPWFYGIAMALVMGLFFQCAWVQTPVWKTPASLWGHNIKIVPDEPYAYYNRGVYYHNQEKHDEAILDYSTAATLVKQNLEQNFLARQYYSHIFQNRGTLMAFTKQFQRAIQDYTTAIDIAPHNPYTYYDRAKVYKQLNDLEKALADYSRAISQEAKLPQAYYNRGLIFTQKKEFQKAIQDYTQTIEIDPSHGKAWNNRGEAYRALGNTEKALLDFDQSILADPDNARPYNNRGIVFFSRKEFQKALADFNQATSIDPEFSRAYFNRAIFWMQVKNYASALRDFETARSLGERVDPEFLKRLETIVAQTKATR